MSKPGMKKKQPAASRAWCFTINNPISDLLSMEPASAEYHSAKRWDYLVNPANWTSPEVRYISWQYEQGASGTPHHQGYVEFEKPQRLTALVKSRPGVHFEPRKGPVDKAIRYTQKDEGRLDGPWEKGERSPGQGFRSDLESVAFEVAAGAKMRDIAEQHPATYVQWGRGLTQLRTILSEPYNHDAVRGEWYWGPPGTGKSRKARDENPGLYLKSQSKWFDGYDGEEVILIDDLDKLGGDKLGHYMKIWADRYACTAEVKGAVVNLRHKKIIITSNYKPEDLWEGEMLKAIERRFKITHFDTLPTHDTTTPPKKKPRTGPAPPMKGVYTAGHANLKCQRLQVPTLGPDALAIADDHGACDFAPGDGEFMAGLKAGSDDDV